MIERLAPAGYALLGCLAPSAGAPQAGSIVDLLGSQSWDVAVAYSLLVSESKICAPPITQTVKPVKTLNANVIPVVSLMWSRM